MKLDNNSIHYCTQCHEDEDESIATHYCNNCNKHLCNEHLILHNKKKQNKDHQLTNLLNVTEQQEEAVKEEQNQTISSFTTSTDINNKEKSIFTFGSNNSGFSFGTTSLLTTSTTTNKKINNNKEKPNFNLSSNNSFHSTIPNTAFTFRIATEPESTNFKPFSFTTTSTSTSFNKSTTDILEELYCKIHKELETDIYCKDCDEAICSKCALFKHKLHEVIDISDNIKEEEEQKMKQLFEDLKFKKEILLQRTENVKLVIKRVNEQASIARNEIDQLVNNLQKYLIKLTLKLDKIVKDKLNALQNEEKLLNEQNSVVNDLCQLKVDNLSRIDILQNKIKFENKVDELNELNVIDYIDFMPCFTLGIQKNLINLINFKLENFKNSKISVDKLFNKQIVKNDFNLIKFEEIANFDGNYFLKLKNPYDIIYNNNLIYIADTDNSRVLILDNLFNYKNEIKVYYPYSLTLNNECLYIGCYKSIYKYNLNTLQLSNENYELKSISGMTLDKDNYLYICNTFNTNNNEIIILNENNEFIRKFKTNNNLSPRRITINNKDQIVITFEKEIQVFDKLGNFILSVKFNNSKLWGIICDDLNNYIVCDFYGQLLLLDNNFNLIKEIKKNFINPIGITLDKTNNQIYVLNIGYSNDDGFINFFK